MQYYKRICRGVRDSGILIPESESVWDYITEDQDYYESLYLYNEEQRLEFEKTRTVAGVTEVVTNQLFFDFDSANDLEAARKDVLELLSRFSSSAEITFTGNKGFSVKYLLSKYISVEQFKEIVFNLAGDLPTFDPVVNNASRILRVANTKHQKSGLYKIQLTLEEIHESPISDILEWAKTPNDIWLTQNVDLPKELLKDTLPKVKKPTTVVLWEDKTLDYSSKPKWLSNCRWSLQNGFYKDGQRSTALLCLASTYKNQGFDLEMTYRMLKGVAELQARQTGTERFPDEEVYNNIILQVYSDTWKNGQYSCREPGNFLHQYCQSLGEKKCDHEHDDKLKPRTLHDVTEKFKDFVKNIDKNTIITGIPAIDENLFLTTGTNTLVLGAPASGKTALALDILENTSKQGIKSVFASLDMSNKRLFEKVMYKISNLSRDELYHKFQTDDEAGLVDKLKEKFGNVFFYDGSCPTVQDIRDYVIACQEASGERIKLVMVDYFERVTSDMSDDTAASKRVAGELQDMVNDLDICLITLVQPNKMSAGSGPDQPIYNYTAIKGSSFVYQAARQILSIWRPFCTPEHKHNDRFLQMAILKNDLGELNEFVFGWNGKRGEISELEDHEFSEFEDLIATKERQAREEDF